MLGVAVFLTTLIDASLRALAAPLGLPVGTLPFCAAAILIMCTHDKLPGFSAVPIADVSTPEDHIYSARVGMVTMADDALEAQQAAADPDSAKLCAKPLPGAASATAAASGLASDASVASGALGGALGGAALGEYTVSYPYPADLENGSVHGSAQLLEDIDEESSFKARHSPDEPSAHPRPNPSAAPEETAGGLSTDVPGAPPPLSPSLRTEAPASPHRVLRRNTPLFGPADGSPSMRAHRFSLEGSTVGSPPQGPSELHHPYADHAGLQLDGIPSRDDSRAPSRDGSHHSGTSAQSIGPSAGWSLFGEHYQPGGGGPSPAPALRREHSREAIVLSRGPSREPSVSGGMAFAPGTAFPASPCCASVTGAAFAPGSPGAARRGHQGMPSTHASAARGASWLEHAPIIWTPELGGGLPAPLPSPTARRDRSRSSEEVMPHERARGASSRARCRSRSMEASGNAGAKAEGRAGPRLAQRALDLALGRRAHRSRDEDDWLDHSRSSEAESLPVGLPSSPPTTSAAAVGPPADPG